MTEETIPLKFVANPFYLDSIEPGTDTRNLEYHGRGEPVYADGRQVMARSCHDALVSYPNDQGEKGILLIRRKGEPAKGYLWPLGGFINRGFHTVDSLVSRIKNESGLDIDLESLRILGFINTMWNTTPHPKAAEKGLPMGIHDTGVLFYAVGHGTLNLDRLHEKPLIVTPEMYTPKLREDMHSYVVKGMDRAIHLLSG